MNTRSSSHDHTETIGETQCYYFPPPGQGLNKQSRQVPEAVGLDSAIIRRINRFVLANQDDSKTPTPRWALWRHGHLGHVEGDFNQTMDVYSHRKTWHAMIVGAAIQQGKIPSIHQKINVWQKELTGKKVEATWWHVITQSAGFDYPHGNHPGYAPGEMWTYSDWNLYHLCHALAKVYGRTDFNDDYASAAKEAYLNAIGMEGWSTQVVFDPLSQMDDGVRFVLSLEHMGRLGLLALARGTWSGASLVPRWFVEELETKQTYGMRVNYNGPYDGKISLDAGRFPEAPYGYLTWVNTDRDFFPDADKLWAWAAGAGGTVTLWNHKNGLVFAAFGITTKPNSYGIPHIIEGCILKPNPLAT